MKYISLGVKSPRGNTTACYAIVDDELYDELKKYNWSLSNHGYAQRGTYNNGKVSVIPMHRQIMGLTFGDNKCVDHINGNRLDNRKSNLRICTRAENSHNMKISKRNKSGAKGVLHVTIKVKRKSGKLYTKEYWRASITLNRKNIYLGFFPYNCEGFQEAKTAYNEAAIKYFGKFARLNE